MTAISNKPGLKEKAWMTTVNYAFKLHLPQAWLYVGRAAHFSRSLTSRVVQGVSQPRREASEQLLSSIRTLKSWPVVWRAAAEKLELEGRQQLTTSNSGENRREAVNKLRDAALYYHYAQIVLGPGDLQEKYDCQRKTQELYRQTALFSHTPAVRVEVPFRGVTLPGYLRQPPLAPGQKSKGLIIFCNGADTVKEEGHRLCHPFLRKNYSTFVFDGPGEGEARERIKGIIKQEDVAQAVIDHLRKEYPALPDKIILFGFSMGGMKALMMAAGEPRISAVVSVSAPFDTRWYFKHLNPLVRGDIQLYFGDPSPECIERLISTCVLDKIAGRIKVPVFSAGGSHDSVLPYREAERIIRIAPQGKNNRLKIYDAGHGCLDRFDLLMKDVVDWLEKI